MRLSRRRTLGILAATALPLPAEAKAAGGVLWRGQALGAEASIRLRHGDRELAETALLACRREIRRLEKIFSLYRRDSAITLLNRYGRLAPAPPELIELLQVATSLSRISDGAFDVTVQPLWQAYVGGGSVSAALALVDWRGLHIEGREVRFAKPEMAITLNGIAQGYMTDQIADGLRRQGFDNVLVHLGEYRGLGGREDGDPWRIGLADPFGSGVFEELDLRDQAIATSSPDGTVLASDDQGDIGHLLDPRTGKPARHWQSVSVIAKRAVIADGLSTAIATAPPDAAADLLNEGGGERAILLGADGQRLKL
jgi:thiamine biosynthesis lipoprotein